jgi:hypothetical protein
LSTIGSASAIANKLRNAGLLNQAREAFVHSLHITAAICALIIAAIVVMVAVKNKKAA